MLVRKGILVISGSKMELTCKVIPNQLVGLQWTSLDSQGPPPFRDFELAFGRARGLPVGAIRRRTSSHHHHSLLYRHCLPR